MPRRVMQGKVVKDGNDKTIIVSVIKSEMHKLYKKYTKRYCKYPTHDPENMFKIGDSVKIMESPPISKTKKWVVLYELNTHNHESLKS